MRRHLNLLIAAGVLIGIAGAAARGEVNSTTVATIVSRRPLRTPVYQPHNLHQMEHFESARLSKNQTSSDSINVKQRLVNRTAPLPHRTQTAMPTTSTTTVAAVSSATTLEATTTPQPTVYIRRKGKRKDEEPRQSEESTVGVGEVEKKRENSVEVPEIVRSSAGNGKEEAEEVSDGDAKPKETTTKEEEKTKTLSDQVAEGKYGLIQNELFQTQPERPGVLSYETNPETTSDNKDTLGGLKDEEIWLAENQLLVLKGGELNRERDDEPWRPIDGYIAPKRPVKLPSNPKVPPPFPVQLDEDGPIQFIGNQNPFPVFNPFTNESINLFGKDGVPKAEPFFENFPFPLSPAENLTYLPPPVFNALVNNQTFVNPYLNFLPPPFPPPGENGTDFIDEDDPSYFYPPPYSFRYESNYSNPVPPGPLVPGIVLPPPPNFFSRLHEPKPIKPGKTTLDVITRLQKINHKTKLYSTTTPTSTILKITPSVEITKANVQGPFVPTTDFERHNLIKPTTAPPSTTARPIYFDYFEANKERPQVTSTTTRKPKPRPAYKEIVRQPVYTEITTQRAPPSNTYLPAKQYDYGKYLYITPKPEIQPNGRPATVSDEFVPSIQLLPSKQSSLRSFEHEIETIKKTLRFYQTTTMAPPAATRTNTARPIYEYSFDTTKQQHPPQPPPPPIHQNTPSPSYGFRPMIPNYESYNYPLLDAITTPPNFIYKPKKKQHRTYPIHQDAYDTSSTTEYPAAAYYEPPKHQQQQHRPRYEYVDVPNTTPPLPQSALISIEKQILRELLPQTGALDPYAPASGPPAPPPGRPTFYREQRYEQPAQQPERVNINNNTYFLYRVRSPARPPPGSVYRPRYRPPPPPPLQKQQQQQQPIPLHSDISVNYKYPLPAVNPDAEYVPFNRFAPNPLIQYKLPGDQAHVYFFTPKK